MGLIISIVWIVLNFMAFSELDPIIPGILSSSVGYLVGLKLEGQLVFQVKTKIASEKGGNHE